jgi:tetratricopeptide (TPR) repeat protein
VKIAIPLFVFLASFVSGIIDSSAAANKPGSEPNRHVLAEIRELEQKQVQYPFDADLHFILGTNYWTLNDEKKAIEHYQRALLLEPDYHSVHWNLSSIYNHRGDGANAITHMKKAEEIFLKKEDSISLAKAREKLKEFFLKYEYKPEDFEARKGLFWRLFN